MSQLSYGNYENRIAAREAKARQVKRDSFKPVQLLDQSLPLLSVAYNPTKNGNPRWIGQVLAAAKDTNHVSITLWQEDIDFLNRVANLAIGTEPMELDNVMIITGHCDPTFGLSKIDVIVTGNGLIRKGDEMPEPDPTPIAVAVVMPKPILMLPAPAQPIALLPAPQETATEVTPATVAIEVLPSPVPQPTRQTITGQCRVKRGALPMVRVYDVVREWKTDHFLIKDPVAGGTFSRHIDEIEFVNKAVA